jgi:NAD(P)H-dependent flavin oxidoreductase YrpB (nitropropane dioxygenase family)
MKTRITEMLGIKYPIICGGMMRLCYPKLCAAISNAGGLGNLTAAMYETKEELKTAIQEVRSQTDKPFIVNVTLLPSIGVPKETYKSYFEAIAEEKVAALELSGVPLHRYEGGIYFDLLKKAGVKIFHKVGSVKHGLSAQKAGYDGIFAAGVEEGGHPLNDNVATTILTPRMVEELDIPVITTGGVASGIGMAAALCLGAEGVMMATRFINTHECRVHENVYKEMINRQENETALYGDSIGLQGRGLLNDSIKKVLEIEKNGGGLKEILPHITGALGDEIWQEGNLYQGLVAVGQTIGLVHDVVSCKELLDRMMKEAEEALDRSKKMFASA